MPKAAKTVRSAHADRRIEWWFQGEARFGQQGTLTRVWAERGTCPRAHRQAEYEWVYLSGSACPSTGATHAGLFPWVNTEAMESYLKDFSRHLSSRTHALLVLGGAGWHAAGQLRVLANVALPVLPPKPPELNPAELPWRGMRQKHLGNRVFPTVEYLDDAVAGAWLAITRNREAMRPPCGCDWILNIGNN